MIGIIDYGVGNVLAFANAYKRMNIPTSVVTREDALDGVERLILPGVGSFDFAMSRLETSGLLPALEEMVVEQEVPLLGVCVGMQMLADSSEEGSSRGLGWVPGTVKKFNVSSDGCEIRLPHMGWNSLIVDRDSNLLAGLQAEAWFYFLHSYYFHCTDSETVLASCNYGMEFSCVVNRDHIYGVQFHPEKSHDYGAMLLRNFAGV